MQRNTESREVLTEMSAAEADEREAEAWWEQGFKETRTGNWDALGGRLLVPGHIAVLQFFYRECPGIGYTAARSLGVTKEIPCGFSELCFHSAGPSLLAMWQLYI